MTLTAIERAILLEALLMQKIDVSATLTIANQRNPEGAAGELFRSWLDQVDALKTKLELMQVTP